MADMNEGPEQATVTESSLRPVAAGPTRRRDARERDPRDVVGDAYDAHQRELFSFAMGSAREPAVAEDAVQEAFLRLVREVGAGRTPENPRAWLYRVVANLLATRGRRAATADRFRGLFAVTDAVETVETGYLRSEAATELHVALAGLEPGARVALLLAAHGFSGREIAAAIQRSEPATRTLMCRARLTLRAQLHPGEVTR